MDRSPRAAAPADRHARTWRKCGLPAICLPHWHVLLPNACFREGETVPRFFAVSVTYSLTNHFAVDRSISVILISSACFLQNSSNDLSVTNVSTTRSWLAEIQTCIWATGTPRRFAARSHEYASSLVAKAAAILSVVEESNDVQILSQNTARELADMRGSRTLSITSHLEVGKFCRRRGKTSWIRRGE